ncbi:MAG: DUF4296 domain-containing protein [Bacteroidales bacterium]
MTRISGYFRYIAACGLIASMLLPASCNFFRAPGKDDCDKMLPRKTMVDVLSDMYLLEAFLVEYQHVQDGVRDSSEYYYAGLFDRHGVDPEQFEAALECYLLDKEEMDLIHEMMLNRLSVMETEEDQMAPIDDTLDVPAPGEEAPQEEEAPE